MDSVFTNLTFFATNVGILTIGAFAVAMILFWDWRVSLVGLALVQIGVGAVAVLLQNMDPQWVMVQTLVIVLCSLILALSGRQTASSGSLRQAGNLFFRGMVLVLLYVCWRTFDLEVSIPLVQPSVALLFVWLGVCALLMLSLNDNPLFTGTALLLWTIPAQVVTSILLPHPSLMVILGILQLLLALSCSYLMLVEKYGFIETAMVATDITFPLPQLPAPPDDVKLLPGPVQRGRVQIGEDTTINIPAITPKAPHPSTQPGAAAERTGEQSSVRSRERTGEHPLVARMAKRKTRPSSSSSSSTASGASSTPSPEAAPNKPT